MKAFLPIKDLNTKDTKITKDNAANLRLFPCFVYVVSFVFNLFPPEMRRLD
jgi:hypothetical protein